MADRHNIKVPPVKFYKTFVYALNCHAITKIILRLADLPPLKGECWIIIVIDNNYNLSTTASHFVRDNTLDFLVLAIRHGKLRWFQKRRIIAYKPYYV